MLCSEWALVKSDGRTATVKPLRCRCWTCDECAPVRKRQLMAQAHAGRPDTFLTLTVNPSRGIDPADRARSLAHAWRSLRKKAIRKYKLDGLPFLAVFEKTKHGEPHLHILLRVKWLSQKWLSRQMQQLIDAPIVDIRRVNGSSKIAAYIAKYIGKDPQRFKGTKRYWSSRDYDQGPSVDQDDDSDYPPVFEVFQRTVLAQVSLMLKDGFRVTDQTPQGIILDFPSNSKSPYLNLSPWSPIPPPPLREGVAR